MKQVRRKDHDVDEKQHLQSVVPRVLVMNDEFDAEEDANCEIDNDEDAKVHLYSQ